MHSSMSTGYKRTPAPDMPSISAIDKTARQSLWRALSTPSVHALNLQVQQDMDLERIVAGQDW